MAPELSMACLEVPELMREGAAAEHVTVLDLAGLHLGAHMGDRVEGEHPDAWPLSQGQYDVLVSFTYNEGAGRQQSRPLLPFGRPSGS